MTTDNPATSNLVTTVHPQGWLTLTEVATRTGHSREAIRQRVRRGVLRAVKGNDGVLRIEAEALASIPLPAVSTDDPGEEDGDALVTAMAVLVATVDDLRATTANLRTELAAARSTLDKAQADRLVDYGRAERLEAKSMASDARASTAEAKVIALEAALAEARTPWTVRVIRAFRK